jgi:bifunctional non-homologous end joining protein LigD
MRVLADITDSHLRLTSRTERDVTVSFPELESITDHVRDGLLDGEIIALRNGIPSFEALADRMHVGDARRAAQLAERVPVTVMAFDVVRLYGVDLLGRPLSERRDALAKIVLPESTWRHSPGYDDGAALHTATREQGLEGTVAKRRTSRYQPGRRSPDWIKTPHRHHQSAVVGGWRPEAGSADKIGALLLGVPGPDGALTFAGRVGSGISGATSAQLLGLLAHRQLQAAPFADQVPRADALGAVWCVPEVVVEVRHLGWTTGHRLRQPVLRGLRPDVAASEVRREP